MVPSTVHKSQIDRAALQEASEKREHHERVERRDWVVNEGGIFFFCRSLGLSRKVHFSIYIYIQRRTFEERTKEHYIGSEKKKTEQSLRLSSILFVL